MKISILSLWRNSTKTIHRTLAQLEALEKYHSNVDFSYYFFENDSTDKTPEILNKWLETRNGKLKSEVLNAPQFKSTGHAERMEYMAIYRNKLLEIARPLDSDYTLIFDSDIIF